MSRPLDRPALARLLDREDFEARATDTLRAFQTHLERAPSAFHQMLLALDCYLGVRQEIVIVGSRDAAETRALLETLRSDFLPLAVVTLRDGAATLPLHEGKEMVNGSPTAYRCENMACGAPVTSAEALRTLVTGQGHS